MTTQDLHIETRLVGIEKNLDSRMDAMQRYQEAADQRARESEARAERLSRDAEERQEKSILRIENTVAEMRKESRGIKRAVRTAAWGAALTAVLGFAGVAALIQNTVNEQGAWVRQNIDRADQDRSELTDTLKSIQATQQSILDRLPPEQTTSPQQ